MKISTRQYLRDLDEAFKKGCEQGRSEVYAERDRQFQRDRIEANMNHLKERVEQLGRMVEVNKKKPMPTCDPAEWDS